MVALTQPHVGNCAVTCTASSKRPPYPTSSNTKSAAIVHRSPQDTMDKIALLDAKSASMMQTIRGLL
jgi:hypothetical protein